MGNSITGNPNLFWYSYEDRIRNYNQANQLFLNDGVGGLTEDTSSALAVGSAYTLAIFAADMDGDGGASARAFARARSGVVHAARASRFAVSV